MNARQLIRRACRHTSKLNSPKITDTAFGFGAILLLEDGRSFRGIGMRTETPCEALRLGRCLEIGYDGFSRIVEVHAVGFSEEGNGLMRVWQVSGGSVSGERTGWKLLRLDEATSYGVTEDPSLAPRKGYRRGDKALARIVCEL